MTLKGDPALCHENVDQPWPPQMFDDMELLVKPEASPQVRGKVPKVWKTTEVLVNGLDQYDWGASWEPSASIRSQSSDFKLEDKVVSEGGSNDRTQSEHVYAKRGKMVWKKGELAKGNKESVKVAELSGVG